MKKNIRSYLMENYWSTLWFHVCVFFINQFQYCENDRKDKHQTILWNIKGQKLSLISILCISPILYELLVVEIVNGIFL